MQLSMFEANSPQFDETKTNSHGKIFILERDVNHSGIIDIEDLEWDYLEGDGDFRSDEVKALRDESDVVITNPPFSLFREFLNWIMEAKKEFLIIGNINCIHYAEVFPRIMNNEAWLGNGMGRWISGFIVPESYPLFGTEARIDADGKRIVSTNNCLWLTNLDHGRRHQPLNLMTMADNVKFSKHAIIREKGYPHYDNYNAIEVAFTDSIPSDYDGIMGVPTTFLDKYNPDQFEILGMTSGRNEFDRRAWPIKRYINAVQHNTNGTTSNGSKANTSATLLTDSPTGIYYTADNCSGTFEIVYARILIRRRQA